MRTAPAKAAFTILEIMIVVTIIGIIAALAVPAFDMIRTRSRISTFTNDLRIFDAAFTNYEAEKAEYPPSEPTDGAYPAGMEGLLSNQWPSSRPISGKYSWVYNPNPDPALSEAFIQIQGTAAEPILLDASELEKVDKNIDDGNLSTGKMVSSGMTIRYYIKRP